MKTILLTGGAGFIGSHLSRMLVRTHKYNVVNLDALTYAGSLKKIEDLLPHPHHSFIHGDIRNNALILDILEKYKIDSIIHCAAQSHVERSFYEPELFFSVNVMGTQCLLDAAKAFWGRKEGKRIEYPADARFLYLSTDEVYGDLQNGGKFSEASPFLPNHPYAASKAAADMMALSYYKTYGLPVLITRGANTYGPNQNPEKLIPHLICAALRNKPLPIQGCGTQKRDWIFVEDHCRAMLSVLEGGIPGEAYNIGANEEHTVLEMAHRIKALLPDSVSSIEFVEDRMYQDRRFALSCEKIRKALSWKPIWGFSKALAHTVQWHMKEEG